jgi:hypothetical protein
MLLLDTIFVYFDFAYLWLKLKEFESEHLIKFE